MYNSIMRYLFLTLCITLIIGNAYGGTRRHKVKNIVIPPAFTTESYLIADSAGTILKEHDSNLQRPIASISKLL